VWDAATGQPFSSPLVHRGWVVSAAFNLDGTRVVTASLDQTAQVWDLRLDTGTLDDWSRVAKRSPFILEGGVVVRRSPPRSEPKPAN
jgi:WD40 repeat protein